MKAQSYAYIWKAPTFNLKLNETTKKIGLIATDFFKNFISFIWKNLKF